MLSTEVRKKAEFICSRIAEKAEVPVSDSLDAKMGEKQPQCRIDAS